MQNSKSLRTKLNFLKNIMEKRRRRRSRSDYEQYIRGIKM
jgi:hypothetical protein